MNDNLKKIRATLDEWDRAYSNGAPIVSDAQYDGLLRMYLAAGGEKFLTRTDTGDIRHLFPMGSLAVVTGLDELKARFAGSCGLAVCTAKADGLAMSCVYRFGKLITGALRSDDGTTGTDVTEAARWFVVNERANQAPCAEIRGEVVLKTHAWQQHFPDMKNPRNAAVGIVKRGGEDARHLSFLPYDSKTIDSANYDWTLHALAGEASERIARFGLFIVGPLKKPEAWDEMVWQHAVESATELTEEVLQALYPKLKALPYWTDGLVFRTIDNAEYEAAGAVGPDPRLAVAFKYPPETTTTTVTSVDFSTGATGIICPRANLSPVLVAGTTVSFATLHNFEHVKRLDVAVGDLVEVHKSGEIIPQIVRVLDRPACRVPIAEPTVCPCCGSKAARKETEEGEGAHLVCTNPRCGSRRASAILRWCRGLGVLGVGDVTAEKLAKAVTGVHELYTLSAQEIGKIIGSEVQAHKLVTQLASRGRGVSLRDFLRHASIPTVGDDKSLKLADKFLTLEAVLNADAPELVAALGVAGATVYDYTTVMLHDLQALGRVCLVKEHVAGAPKAKLPGICITGTLSKDREAYAEEINATGRFVFDKSVLRSTHYLVVGDKAGAAKVTAAANRGVECITEQQLWDLLK